MDALKLTPITHDFPAIQQRFIDYKSPQASDNHNRLLDSETGYDHRKYLYGFGITPNNTFEADIEHQSCRIKIKRGICIVGHMIINFTRDFCIPLFTCPIQEPKWIYVVVEYRYEKKIPVNTATVKVVDEIDPTCQLRLYSFRLPAWDVLPTDKEIEDTIGYGSVRPYDPNDPDYTPGFIGPGEDGDTDPHGDRNGKDPWGQGSGGGVTNPDPNDPNPWDPGDPGLRKGYVKITGDQMIGALYTPELETPSLNISTNGELRHNRNILGMFDDNGLTLRNDTTAKFSSNQFTSSDGRHMMRYVKDAATDVDALRFEYNGKAVAYLDAKGILGTLSSDLAEIFEHDLKEKPKQGTCVVFDDQTGKAVLSKRGDFRTVIGVVSYNPGLLLGNDSSRGFDKLFEEGYIPVALLGQIKSVDVNSENEYPAGTYLVPDNNGKLRALPKSNINPEDMFNIVGKSMTPLHTGINQIKILVNVK